ncbi:hypothetical protein L2E82_47018 [Cichorium intybus]|uniref:Uncharacterized protein n=1 Tax=Cichorium intybus TaxID=13427 RepID=A0ACB8YVF5_CICIN|nr:hypothetical protein L2E82_47018 [Cichorium intybus]
MNSLESALSHNLGILQGPVLQFTKKRTNCLVGDFREQILPQNYPRIPTGISLASGNRQPVMQVNSASLLSPSA